MSLPDRSKPVRARRRMALGLAALIALPGFAACTFTPVYGPHGDTPTQLALSYAAPNSRLEQIVYQDLRAKLGGAGPDSPQLKISVSQTTRSVGRTAVSSVFSTSEVVLTGHVIVSDNQDNGKILFDVYRVASAGYETSGQLEADAAAKDDAGIRAAHTLAETIRLSLIAQFAQGRATP